MSSAKDSALAAKEEATGRFARLREQHQWLDHVVRTVQHYGSVKGNALAGAVTYFGFLSFFPILALAFAVVGWVSSVYDVEQQVVEAIRSVLPMVVAGEAGAGEISISTFQSAAGAAAGVGALGVLYSGLGWVSGLRDALLLTFEKPAGEQPNIVVGKGKDLVSLVLVGLVLLLSVGVAGLVGSLSESVLDLLGLGAGLDWLMQLVSVVVGLAANMVLFYALFRLLADPDTPRRALWAGALLGAVGFEALKKLAFLLLGATKEQPAFAVFGIALVLLVWINYFSRVVIYAASWAHTDRRAREAREAAERAAEEAEPLEARVDAVRTAGVPAAPGLVPAYRDAADRGSAARTAGVGALGALAGYLAGRRR